MESGKKGLPGGRSSTCKPVKVGTGEWSAEVWGAGGWRALVPLPVQPLECDLLVRVFLARSFTHLSLG